MPNCSDHEALQGCAEHNKRLWLQQRMSRTETRLLFRVLRNAEPSQRRRAQNSTMLSEICPALISLLCHLVVAGWLLPVILVDSAFRQMRAKCIRSRSVQCSQSFTTLFSATLAATLKGSNWDKAEGLGYRFQPSETTKEGFKTPESSPKSCFVPHSSHADVSSKALLCYLPYSQKPSC